jgi:hypothetical protein
MLSSATCIASVTLDGGETSRCSQPVNGEYRKKCDTKLLLVDCSSKSSKNSAQDAKQKQLSVVTCSSSSSAQNSNFYFGHFCKEHYEMTRFLYEEYKHYTQRALELYDDLRNKFEQQPVSALAQFNHKLIYAYRACIKRLQKSISLRHTFENHFIEQSCRDQLHEKFVAGLEWACRSAETKLVELEEYVHSSSIAKEQLRQQQQQPYYSAGTLVSSATRNADMHDVYENGNVYHYYNEECEKNEKVERRTSKKHTADITEEGFAESKQQSEASRKKQKKREKCINQFLDTLLAESQAQSEWVRSSVTGIPEQLNQIGVEIFCQVVLPWLKQRYLNSIFYPDSEIIHNLEDDGKSHYVNGNNTNNNNNEYEYVCKDIEPERICVSDEFIRSLDVASRTYGGMLLIQLIIYSREQPIAALRRMSSRCRKVLQEMEMAIGYHLNYMQTKMPNWEERYQAAFEDATQSRSQRLIASFRKRNERLLFRNEHFFHSLFAYFADSCDLSVDDAQSLIGCLLDKELLTAAWQAQFDKTSINDNNNVITGTSSSTSISSSTFSYNYLPESDATQFSNWNIQVQRFYQCNPPAEVRHFIQWQLVDALLPAIPILSGQWQAYQEQLTEKERQLYQLVAPLAFLLEESEFHEFGWALLQDVTLIRSEEVEELFPVLDCKDDLEYHLMLAFIARRYHLDAPVQGSTSD